MLNPPKECEIRQEFGERYQKQPLIHINNPKASDGNSNVDRFGYII